MNRTFEIDYVVPAEVDWDEDFEDKVFAYAVELAENLGGQVDGAGSQPTETT